MAFKYFPVQSSFPLITCQDKKLQEKKSIRLGPFHQMTSKEPARKLNSVARVHRTCQCSVVASNMSNHEDSLKQARLHFAQEIMCTKLDSEVSLVKTLLLISAEDEAFISLNRAKDKLAVQIEGRCSLQPHANVCGNKGDDGFHIAGRTMAMWLSRFDFLAGEVKKILVCKGSEPKPAEILKAVNFVLFEIQGFKTSVTDDVQNFYLYLVMTLGSGSGLLLCIIYMEICKRVGITVKVAEVGSEVVVWPLVDKTQDEQRSWLLEHLEAQNKSHLFDINSKSLYNNLIASMQFPSNKDILGKVLTKLKIAHWIAACKSQPGRSLTGALHPLVSANEGSPWTSARCLLRPEELRCSSRIMRSGLIMVRTRGRRVLFQAFSACLRKTAPAAASQLACEKGSRIVVVSQWEIWRSSDRVEHMRCFCTNFRSSNAGAFRGKAASHASVLGKFSNASTNCAFHVDVSGMPNALCQIAIF